MARQVIDITASRNRKLRDRLEVAFNQINAMTAELYEGVDSSEGSQSNEQIDDRVATLIQDGTGISWSYNDSQGKLTPTVSLSPFTTTNLTEGSNLYYTQGRFDSAFGAKDTDDLSEGSNLYFTNERVDDRVNSLIQDGTGISWNYDDGANTLTPTISLSPFDTDDLSEGSNLYYTQGRFDSAFSAKSTTDLSEGSNLYFTNERAQDAAWDVLTGTQTLITVTYDDVNNEVDFVVNEGSIDHGSITGLGDDDHTQYHNDARALTWLGTRSTSDLPEGTNLYYTDGRVETKIDSYVNKAFVEALGINITEAQISDLSHYTDENARDAIGAALVGGTDISVTVDDGADTITIAYTGSGGGASNLADLNDVTISSIASGEILKWNGSAWVNNTLTEAGIAAASHNHAASAITSGTFNNDRIAESNVTQHQAALSITQSQIPDANDTEWDTAYDRSVTGLGHNHNAAGRVNLSRQGTTTLTTELSSLRIGDARATADFPTSNGSSSFMPPPDWIGFDDGIVPIFTQGWAGNSWGSVINIKGWNGSYASWQIAGNANNSTEDKWYLRTGINSTWNSWHEIWHSGNDGHGSGLHADLLDGKHASEANNNSTIVARNASGDITTRLFRPEYTSLNTGSNIAYFWTSRGIGSTGGGADNYLRPTTAGEVKNRMAALGLVSTPYNGNFTLTSSTSSRYLKIEADTDNDTESHNPYLWFSQDGAAVEARIGLSADANEGFGGAALTGSAANSVLFQNDYSGGLFEWAHQSNVIMSLSNSALTYSTTGSNDLSFFLKNADVTWDLQIDGNASLTDVSRNGSLVVRETSGSVLFLFDPLGFVAAPAIKNNTTGNAGNTFTSPSTGYMRRSTSSLRYKEEVETIDDTLVSRRDYSSNSISEMLSKFRPIRYKHRGDGGYYIGFGAEEVHQIMPELCTYDKEGKPDWVQYPHISALLVGGWQKHESKIQQLQAKVLEHEKEIAGLKTRIAELR